MFSIAAKKCSSVQEFDRGFRGGSLHGIKTANNRLVLVSDGVFMRLRLRVKPKDLRDLITLE